MSGRAQGYFSCGRFFSAVSVLGALLYKRQGRSPGWAQFWEFLGRSGTISSQRCDWQDWSQGEGSCDLALLSEVFYRQLEFGSWSSWVAVILWNYVLFRPPFLDRLFCESGSCAFHKSKPHRPTDSLAIARRDVAQTCPYWQAWLIIRSHLGWNPASNSERGEVVS